MKKTKERTAVADSFLYRICLPEWWPALDAHCRILKFKKGAAIFNAGDAVEGIYFVIDGIVKVHKRWEQEKELIIRFAGPDDILGHRGLSTHSTVYPVSATAITSGTLCFLELAFFHKTLIVNQQLLYTFMLFLADELQLSEQRMQQLAHVPVKKRVAKAILEIHKKIGIITDAGPAIIISRRDLAAYTGATYETVYRFLMEFSVQGWIAATGSQLVLRNVPALQDLAI